MMVIKYYSPTQDGCRTNRITIRLSDSETEWLKDAAWQSRMSQAEFIRSRVFQKKVPEMPAELKNIFQRLDYSLSKIGNNINQIARVANTSGYTNTAALRKLDSMMEDLMDLCRKTYESVMEVYRDGDYKATSD